MKCSLSSGSFLHVLHVGSTAYRLMHDLLTRNIYNIYEPHRIFALNSVMYIVLDTRSTTVRTFYQHYLGIQIYLAAKKKKKKKKKKKTRKRVTFKLIENKIYKICSIQEMYVTCII